MSVATASLLFIAGLVSNTYAINFASERASNSVTDIILSNTPVLDVDGLFVYGTVVFAIITVALCLAHPKRIPFALYSVGLFFLIRSAFVSMTHLAPFENHYTVAFGATVTKMFYGADLFFSGHTGLPFLGALGFWRYPRIRYFFLAGSAYFAAVVLFGHLHYTIDVISAFFITYGIFDLASWLFPAEKTLFYED